MITTEVTEIHRRLRRELNSVFSVVVPASVLLHQLSRDPAISPAFETTAGLGVQRRFAALQNPSDRCRRECYLSRTGRVSPIARRQVEYPRRRTLHRDDEAHDRRTSDTMV